MQYFDSYASIGMNGPVDGRIPWKKETLLNDMKHTGINASLVWHWTAREYDPAYGNNVLMEEIKNDERLIPCWVLIPHHCGEMAPGEEIVQEMIKQGVPAAKMFPRRHHYPFNEKICGEIFTALEKHQIPLLIDTGIFGEYLQATFDELDEICKNHPNLPIIMQSARWESPREIIPFMQRNKNTYIEFSNYQIHYGPEFMAEKVGSDRLILGTEWPFKSPGAAKSLIDYCELSEKDKALMASGNLMRLLKMNKPLPEYPEIDRGPILNKAMQGKPVDHVPVIDTHSHVLHDGMMGSGYIPIPHGDCEHMVRRNHRLGIDRFCCSSWIGIWIDYKRGNELIHDLETRYPEDIIGYATIEPNKTDDYAGDIHLCHDVYGFRGLKPYNPRVAIPYNDPRYDPWYEKGNEVGGFVKLHQTAIGDNYLNEIADISERYPNMNYLLAHSAWTWEVAHSRIQLAKERKNVYLDLTFTSVLHGVIEYFVEEGLADKVLFTTDAPMRDAIQQFGWVVYADISEDDKEKILGGNALRILEHAGLPVESLKKKYGIR